MVSPEPIKPVTKDTLFNLKFTGEELVHLAIICGKGGTTIVDDNVYEKVATVLKERIEE